MNASTEAPVRVPLASLPLRQPFSWNPAPWRPGSHVASILFSWASAGPRVIFIDRYTVSVIEKLRRVRVTSGLGLQPKNRLNRESGSALYGQHSLYRRHGTLAGLAGSLV